MIRSLVFAAAYFLAEAQSPAPTVDWAKAQPTWITPFAPFRIIGDIYYVGTEGLAVYLIAGEDGHVLIDGGLPAYEQMIVDNIAALGFDIHDVMTLLNTHAHFDHSGGLAKLKEISGGELIASEGDVSALEGGFYLGFEDHADYAAPPVKVDRPLTDKALDEGVRLGLRSDSNDARTYLTPVSTPGHSRGCTSWRVQVEDDRTPYDVLIFCSATVAANRLVPEQYPGIVGDYRDTFEKTKDWTPDVFLANHPEVYFMKETREKQKAGDGLAFVNRGAFSRYIADKKRAFEEALAAQRAEAEY